LTGVGSVFKIVDVTGGCKNIMQKMVEWIGQNKNHQ